MVPRQQPLDHSCTWVAVEAFENGDQDKAPRNGTIRKVRLISCVAGSFTVQVARARPGDDGKAKIVRQGPTINYAKDNQSGTAAARTATTTGSSPSA